MSWLGLWLKGRGECRPSEQKLLWPQQGRGLAQLKKVMWLTLLILHCIWMDVKLSKILKTETRLQNFRSAPHLGRCTNLNNTTKALRKACKTGRLIIAGLPPNTRSSNILWLQIRLSILHHVQFICTEYKDNTQFLIRELRRIQGTKRSGTNWG